MGHLNIVNQATVQNLIDEGHVATTGALRTQWVKTAADVFSDVLGTRPGQKIFPWIVKGAGGENLGFKYVFEITGRPFIAEGEEYPVKLPVKSTGLEYEEPLPEAEALSLWDRRLLWNAIGKKSLGRGRSLTPQTPMEDDRLIELLDERNATNSSPNEINLGAANYRQTKRVSIYTNSPVASDSALDDERSPDRRLAYLDPRQVPWTDGEHFAAEKALEAWLMENLDQPEASQFRKLALPSDRELHWFSNYLPFGVQGGNMDAVIVQKDGDVREVTVVELKRGSLTEGNFRSAAKQASDYAEFVRRAFNAYGYDVRVDAAVLAGDDDINRKKPSVSALTVEPSWLTYRVDDTSTVVFDEIR